MRGSRTTLRSLADGATGDPVTSASLRGQRESLVRALALVVVVAWNVRTLLAVVGAASGTIEKELDDGGAVTGSISTILVFAAAIAAPLALVAVRRSSVWLVTGLSLALLAAAQLGLGLGGTQVVFVASLFAGLGAGMIGALTPSLVARLLPHHVGLGVGVFMVGASVGFYAASIAVPWALDRGGSWTHVAVVLASLAALSVAVWAVSPYARRASGSASDVGTDDAAGAARLSMFARLPSWVVVVIVYLCVQSISVFAVIAWTAPTLVEAGASLSTASVALGLVSGLQVVTGLALPLVAQRTGKAPVLMLAAAGAVLVGSVAFVAVVTGSALAWSWVGVTLLAFGHGGSFALATFVVAHKAPDARSAVTFGAMMMFYSQVAGACGPFAFGWLRDVSGGYVVPWVLLSAVAALQVVSAVVLVRLFARDALRSAHH